MPSRLRLFLTSVTCHHTANEVRLLSMLAFLVGAEIERAWLETKNFQLAYRLETRRTIDRVKSTEQRDLSLSQDDAYCAMHTESRQRRKSMREITEAFVLSEDLRKTTPSLTKPSMSDRGQLSLVSLTVGGLISHLSVGTSNSGQ